MAERVRVARVKRDVSGSAPAGVPLSDLAPTEARPATPRRVRSRGYELHTMNASSHDDARTADDTAFGIEDYLAPQSLFEKRVTPPQPVPTAECEARPDGRFSEHEWQTPGVDAVGVLQYEVGSMDLPSSFADAPQRARGAGGANMREITRTFADSAAAAGSRAHALTARNEAPVSDFTGACRTVDRSVVQHRAIAEKIRDLMTDNEYIHPAYDPGSKEVAWLLPLTARRLGAKSPFAQTSPGARSWPREGLFRRSA
jgi:hypothetical protein